MAEDDETQSLGEDRGAERRKRGNFDSREF